MDKKAFVDLLVAAKTIIEENFDYLNQLDSATGDGDHGTAAVAAMTAAVNKGKESLAEDKPIDKILNDIGWAVMTETSGSTSSLLGSLFLGMGEKPRPVNLDASDIADMFKCGLANVQTMTDAKPGDKTLMDALDPAITAIGDQIKANQNRSIHDLFVAASDAAAKGAESTRDLAPKFGRARNLCDRAKGHVDAGATSISLVFRAFADGTA